jgi:hypothetical protein
VRPTAPSHHRRQGTGDATRDWHGHPPHFRGGGFLGGGPAPSGWANRLTRSGLEGFGRSLSKEDEVVVEATGNATAVVRVYAARVIVANPLSLRADHSCGALKYAISPISSEGLFARLLACGSYYRAHVRCYLT